MDALRGIPTIQYLSILRKITRRDTYEEIRPTSSADLLQALAGCCLVGLQLKVSPIWYEVHSLAATYTDDLTFLGLFLVDGGPAFGMVMVFQVCMSMKY